MGRWRKVLPGGGQGREPAGGGRPELADGQRPELADGQRPEPADGQRPEPAGSGRPEPAGAVWRVRRAVAACVVVSGSLFACTPAPRTPQPAATALPTLRVEQRAPADTAISLHVRAPRTGSLVTVTAVDADVRDLVPALAAAAGLNVVLGPDVRGRVSVSYQDVPAAEALRATLEAAGLALLAPLRSPSSRTVFYNVPVNIDTADVALMQAAFGVSRAMAKFLVQVRTPPASR